LIAHFSPKLININLYFWEVNNTQQRLTRVHLASLTQNMAISSGYNLKDCGGSDQRQYCLYTEDVTGATLMGQLLWPIEWSAVSLEPAWQLAYSVLAGFTDCI